MTDLAAGTGGRPAIITRTATINSSDGARANEILVAAGGANVMHHVTRVTVTASKANSVNTLVGVYFGASLPGEAVGGADGVLFYDKGMAAGERISENGGGDTLGSGAGNEPIRYDCDKPFDGSLVITISYFTTGG